MSRNHILYLPLTGKEALWSGLLVCVYMAGSLALSLFLPFSGSLPAFLWAIPFFAVLLWLLRRFWRQTWNSIPFTGWQLLWKPVAAFAAGRLVCIVMNDLLLLYGVKYFVNTAWGPMLWDIRAAVTASQSLPVITALSLLVLFPVLEELFFRGVIFGCLYKKSALLATILSVLLYAAYHTAMYWGRLEDPLYFAIYFAQFIPAGLLLCWSYTSTNSILAPIAAHVLSNLILLRTSY